MPGKLFSDKDRADLLARVERIAAIAVPKRSGDSDDDFRRARGFQEDIGALERELAAVTAPQRRDASIEREQAKVLIMQALQALPAHERADLFDEVWQELWDAQGQ